jgi:lipopolysaccharide export LptBFGC system permease protein LptF
MLIARSVLGEVTRNFLASLTATTSVAFFLLCITFMKRTPGIGLGFLVEIFPLFFPLALQFTLPLSVLTGTVMTYSRMAQEGELSALNASGVPLMAVARPVLAGAALVALLAFLLTDLSAPFSAARLRQARRDLLQQLQTSFRSGLCDLDLGRGRISFESFSGRDFRDGCVEWRKTEEDAELWRAERGSIAVTDDDRVVIELHNAQEVLPRATSHGDLSLAVRDVVVERSLAEIVGEGRRRRKHTGMNARELAYVGAQDIQAAPGIRVTSRLAREELARRAALAASAFFFALVGIPLGVLTARGGRVAALLVGIGPVLVVYFPLVIAGSNLARNGKLPALPALWAGNLIFLLLGLLLFWRVTRR